MYICLEILPIVIVCRESRHKFSGIPDNVVAKGAGFRLKGTGFISHVLRRPVLAAGFGFEGYGLQGKGTGFSPYVHQPTKLRGFSP